MLVLAMTRNPKQCEIKATRRPRKTGRVVTGVLRPSHWNQIRPIFPLAIHCFDFSGISQPIGRPSSTSLHPACASEAISRPPSLPPRSTPGRKRRCIQIHLASASKISKHFESWRENARAAGMSGSSCSRLSCGAWVSRPEWWLVCSLLALAGARVRRARPKFSIR